MVKSTVSRRRFLALAGGAVAVSILSCGGLAALGMNTTAVDFGATSCVKEGRMKKVLVAYASKCGSTAEVAQAIADRLCGRGETVDVLPAAAVKDLSQYKAAVIGSAVRMGRWLPAATRFVQEQSSALGQMPVSCFTVHILATDGSAESAQKRAAYVEPLHALVTPRSEAFFAGKIEQRKMDLGARLMTKAMGAKDNDQRDWQAIAAWADALPVG